MEPARLARTWTRRLPGAAILALDRLSRDLAVGTVAVEPTAAAPEVAPSAPVAAMPASAMSALEAGLTRRSQRAGAALRGVRDGLGEGDVAAAATALARARVEASPLAGALDAWLDLFAAELAFAGGDLGLAAQLSCAAEASAHRAGDAAAFVAVWWIRGMRALRRGEGGDGELIARWMDGWLDELAPRQRHRLRCFTAAFVLDDERPEAAIAIAAETIGTIPGTIEAALCGSIIAQAFLALGRTTDAARVATSSIERSPEVPPRVRARQYYDAALALEAAGLDDEAARCAELALRLDPRVAADASAAELTGHGLEVLLL